MHIPSLNSVQRTLCSSNSELWAVAIAVGVLVLGAGVFGAIGLFHTHGLLCLPHWLSSAIGTIGAIPYNIGLWALAGGGFAVGSGLIMTGIIKMVRTHENIEQPALGNMVREGDVKQAKGVLVLSPDEMMVLEFVYKAELEAIGFSDNNNDIKVTIGSSLPVVPEKKYQIFKLTGAPLDRLIMVKVKDGVDHATWFCRCQATEVDAKITVLENMKTSLP